MGFGCLAIKVGFGSVGNGVEGNGGEWLLTALEAMWPLAEVVPEVEPLLSAEGGELPCLFQCLTKTMLYS